MRSDCRWIAILRVRETPSDYRENLPTKERSFRGKLKMAETSDTVVSNVTTPQFTFTLSNPASMNDDTRIAKENGSGDKILDPIPYGNGSVMAKKQNGAALRTNSLGAGTRTPPLERKSKFSALGRLFKPWKWKRKKKSDKFEAASKALERKISVRANRDELVQKGILMPESPTSPLPIPGCMDAVPQLPAAASPPPQQLPPISAATTTATTTTTTLPASTLQEPKKDKTEQANGSLSPTGEVAPALGCSDSKPERPSSLGPTKLTRRLLCYHSEHCMSHNSPPRPGTVPIINDQGDIDGDEDDEEDDDEDGEARYLFRVPQPDPSIDTSRVEEIPAKEPKFHAVPLKSALKKKGSGGSGPGTPQNTPTQESRPLAVRQEHTSSFNTRPVRFGIALPCTMENKENTRPYVIREDTDSDSGDGPVLYRDDDDEESRLAAKIARKDSLALKLALRPNRQELIARNIIHEESENERMETKEAIGARLIRRLSMRPTQEELEERNILKKQTAAEEKKMKEEKKRMLLRKLSFRPTVEELKEKKIIRFNDYIEVTQAHEYDRRADKPWTRLTPKDKAAIRKELNEFKSSEMEVHEDSRHLTRFHRP